MRTTDELRDLLNVEQPIIRNESDYQTHMNESIDMLNEQLFRMGLGFDVDGKSMDRGLALIISSLLDRIEKLEEGVKRL